MPPELTHAVAAFSHDVTLSQVPEAALERARTAILDTLGVMLAARDEPVARIVIDYARSTGSTGPAGIVGHPLHTAPETAARPRGRRRRSGAHARVLQQPTTTWAAWRCRTRRG
jgi:2-methylcitrate dehydratase PrpD